MSEQTISATNLPTSGAVQEPLQPLRAALLAAAERDARAETTHADQEYERRVDAARREANRLREAARAEGERDAEQLRVEQRARARRRARATVLAEQRRALDELRHEVERRLTRLWNDQAAGNALRDRLAETARADLGETVDISDLPEGGIVATADHARATYRLAYLADQVIDALGAELTGLWTP